MDAQQRQVQFKGAPWIYYTAGRGITAVLAFAGSLGACKTLVKVLAEMIPDRKIIAPAYPVVATTDELFEGIHAILSAESARPDTVYGGSFGGMLAQQWLRRNLPETQFVVLSGCGAPDPSRGRANRRSIRAVRFFPMFLMRAVLRLILQKLMKDVKRDSESWRSDYDQLISQLKTGDLVTRYRLSIEFDEGCRFSPSDLDEWRGRLLILEGEQDTVAKPATRESLRRLYPGAIVHTLPAGHSVLLTHPEECARLVQGLMQER